MKALVAFAQGVLGALALGAFQPEQFVGFGQFGGPSLNAAFQLPLSLLQRMLPRLDLSQHMVEAIEELPQFIFTLLAHAHRIVVLHCHGTSGLGQVQNRPGDQPLQAAGQQKGHQGRGQQDPYHDSHVLAQPLVQGL